MASKDAVYEQYAFWTTDAGYGMKGKNVFFRELLAAYRGELETGRVRVDGKQVQMLKGARLKTEI